MGYPEFSIVFCTVVAALLMGVTHGMFPWENFDLRCSEMLCSGHVFACGKTTSAGGLGSVAQI